MDLFQTAAKDITVNWMHKETETEQHFTRIYENRWRTAEGESAEELRGEYRQRLIAEDEIVENEHLQQTVLSEQGNADADGAAPGQPMLDQAAAKKTRKQQREDRRRDNKAKRISNNQNADHVSYNMVERLQTREKAADAYINGSRFQRDQEKKDGWAKQVKDADVNPELLKAFYKEGGTFIDDYTRAEALQKTGKAMVYEKEEREARTRALDGIVNDMIATQITPEMLKPAYLELHIDEMKALADRMRYFRDICADRNNSFYFENEKKDIGIDTRVKLLNAKLELTDVLCAQLDYAASQKAVDVGKGDYIRQTQQQDALTADLLQNEGQTTVQRQDQENVLTQKLQELQQKENSIYAGAVEQELQEKLKTVRDDWHMEDSEESYIKTLQYEIAMEHEENYHKYQGAVDSIFLEECRAGDISAEMSGTMMAYQLANREYQAKQEKNNSVVDKRMAELTLAKQKEYEKRYNDVEKNRQAYTEALDYYLKDKDTLGNKDVPNNIQKLIFENARDSGHMAELANRVFLGKSGTIAHSDYEYHHYGNGARSRAIMLLQLRTSSSLEAHISDSFTSAILKGGEQEAIDYYERKKSENVNFTAMAKSEFMKEGTVNGLSRYRYEEKDQNAQENENTLTGFNAITRELMDKFLERLQGKEVMEYMRFMLPNIENAQVFKDDKSRIENENKEREKDNQEITNTAHAVLTQNLMLKFTGAGGMGAIGSETFKGQQDAEDIEEINKRARQTLQSVASMVGTIKKEQEAALPGPIKELLNKYRSGIKDIGVRLQQGKDASDAAADVDNAAVDNNILDGGAE